MSYILDALRRADSERDRGAVPNLFAQPLPRVSIESAEAGGQRLLLWLAGGVVVVLLVGIAWWRLGTPSGSTVSPIAENVPSPATVPSPPSAVADARSETTTAPTRPFIPVPARLPDTPKPVRKATPLAAAPATGSITGAASAAEPRLYARNELPGDVQRALPTLAIGGASYSESPANRMLIINGQVFHEGDQLAPDLVLEQIKLKTAVLRFKGYRYGVSY